MDNSITKLDVFNAKERAVYLTLLHLGTVRVSDIVKTSGLDKKSVYEILHAFEKRGFVRISKRKNLPLVYEVTDPQNIADYYSDILREIDRKRALVREVAAELNKIYESADTLHIQHMSDIRANQELIKTIINKEQIVSYEVLDADMFWENVAYDSNDIRYTWTEWPTVFIIRVGDAYGRRRYRNADLYTVPQEDFPFRGEFASFSHYTALVVRKSPTAYEERGILIDDPMIANLVQGAIKLAVAGVKSLIAEQKKLTRRPV